MKNTPLKLLIFSAFFVTGLSGCFSRSSGSDSTTNYSTQKTAETNTRTSSPTTSQPSSTSTTIIDQRIHITSVSDLTQMNNSSKSFILDNDIDFSGVSSYMPIKGFKGVFDGDNHKISNFNLTFSSTENIGLFADCAGQVKNLTMHGNLTVNGVSSNIGLLAGTLAWNASLVNVITQGSIDARYSTAVGGIAGKSNSSYNSSDLVNEAPVYGGHCVGGLIGWQVGSITVTTIENKGNVTATEYSCGGCFGLINGGYDYHPTINDATNRGIISASGNSTGGIVGYSSCGLTKINNSKNYGTINGTNRVGGINGGDNYEIEYNVCENYGPITATGIKVGGIQGGQDESLLPRSTFKNCKNTGTITGTAYLGGIAGTGGPFETCVNESGEIVSTNGYFEGESLSAVVGGIAGYAFGNIKNCTNKVSIAINYAGLCVGGIAGLLYEYGGHTFTNNTNEADVASAGYNVGGFAGKVYYGGEYIANLHGNLTDTVNCGNVSGKGRVGGLIGKIESIRTSVEYLNISNCANHGSVTIANGENYVGGLVGQSIYGINSISVCTSDTDIIAPNSVYVGGFVGYTNTGKISYLTNENDVKGVAYVGGIAGFAYDIDNCENKGRIEATSGTVVDSVLIQALGGIAGSLISAQNCINNGEIIACANARRVGGIAAEVRMYSNTVIENNQNHVSINAPTSNSVGGIFGVVHAYESPATFHSTYIRSNVNTGSVTGSEYVGGIIGAFNGTSSDYEYKAYFAGNNNSGNVTASVSYAGGICGWAKFCNDTATVLNSNTNSGIVTAPSNAGNIIGAIINS